MQAPQRLSASNWPCARGQVTTRQASSMPPSSRGNGSCDPIVIEQVRGGVHGSSTILLHHCLFVLDLMLFRAVVKRLAAILVYCLILDIATTRRHTTARDGNHFSPTWDKYTDMRSLLMRPWDLAPSQIRCVRPTASRVVRLFLTHNSVSSKYLFVSTPLTTRARSASHAAAIIVIRFALSHWDHQSCRRCSCEYSQIFLRLADA